MASPKLLIWTSLFSLYERWCDQEIHLLTYYTVFNYFRTAYVTLRKNAATWSSKWLVQSCSLEQTYCNCMSGCVIFLFFLLMRYWKILTANWYYRFNRLMYRRALWLRLLFPCCISGWCLNQVKKRKINADFQGRPFLFG